MFSKTNICWKFLIRLIIYKKQKIDDSCFYGVKIKSIVNELKHPDLSSYYTKNLEAETWKKRDIQTEKRTLTIEK